MFWRRKKKDAISSWQAEATTTQTTIIGEPSTVTTKAVMVGSDMYDPSNPEHRKILATAEAATGMDLDGDGTVAERPAGTTAFSVSPDADPISQLERLQRLRESGALTEPEFAEQKRRILDAD